MKTPQQQQVKSELARYRAAIESDVERLGELLDPTLLRKRAANLVRTVWQNPRQRWALVGLAGVGLLFLLFGRRNRPYIERHTGEEGGTQIVVQPRSQPTLAYLLLQELLKYVLLTLAKRLLKAFLAPREKAGGTTNQSTDRA